MWPNIDLISLSVYVEFNMKENQVVVCILNSTKKNSGGKQILARGTRVPYHGWTLFKCLEGCSFCLDFQGKPRREKITY